MICCEPSIFQFGAVSTLTVPYSAAMAAEYGPQPNVQVYIKEGEEYVLSDDMSGVIFDGSNIIADFGGMQTGFVKVF